MKKSWFGIFFKVLIIITFLFGVHTQTQLFPSSKQDLSHLTTFKSLDFKKMMSNLNLVDASDDKASLLAWGSSSKETDDGTLKPIDNKENIKKKKIYIYNTHQHETYVGDGNVVLAAKYLKEGLEKVGYIVDVEEANFNAYREANELGNNDYYQVSKIFLEEKLIQNGPYDLIIDLHRDAASKNITTLNYQGKEYAKLMFVVGNLSDNHTKVEALSKTLSVYLDREIPGITRKVFYRQSYYNQQVVDHMVLVEVGAQYNTYEEVKASLDVLVVAIDNYLKEELS